MYAYCGGNPINYVDPSGHFVVAIPLVEYYFISAVVSIVVTKEAIDVVSAKRHKTKEYNPTCKCIISCFNEKRYCTS